MSIISTRYRVVGHYYTIGRDKYGRCMDSTAVQTLRKEWLVFGCVVFWWVVDYEEIPSWAWISSACFGDTNGWISKFAPFDRDGIVK